MKKVICLIFALLMLLTALVGCGPKKTLHCDRCGKAVEVDADINMEEDWIIFCRECEEQAFGYDPVVKPTD